PDVLAAGFDERPRPVAPQHVVHRGPGELDRVERVVLGVRVLAPAVADDQDQRGVLGGGVRHARSLAAAEPTLRPITPAPRGPITGSAQAPPAKRRRPWRA